MGGHAGIHCLLFIRDPSPWNGANHIGAAPYTCPEVCVHGDSNSHQVDNQRHSVWVLESLQCCPLSQGCPRLGISLTVMAVPCFLACWSPIGELSLLLLDDYLCDES